MHAFTQFRFDRMKFGGEPLLQRDPTDHELPISVYATIVSKTKEVERFRFPPSVEAPAVSLRESSETYEASLLGVEFQ